MRSNSKGFWAIFWKRGVGREMLDMVLACPIFVSISILVDVCR